MPRQTQRSKIGPQTGKRKMLYAFLAYFSWGFIPAYLKLLVHFPLTQVMFHRSLWAFVFFTLLLFISKKRLTDFFSLRHRQKLYIIISSALLGINWAIYLYAVNTNQVVEGSLGYFINPLFNFLLGFLFLNEKLPPLRRRAVTLAVLGVLWLTFLAGSFPWIGLSLGLTFGLYGLIRKVAQVPATSALQIESLILSVGWLFIFHVLNPNLSLAPPLNIDGLFLMGAGLTTGIPLYWFSKAVLVTPLNILGFLQFIAPSIQFLLGVFIYSEAFPPQKLVGFLFIWSSVLLLILEFIFFRKPKETK